MAVNFPSFTPEGFASAAKLQSKKQAVPPEGFAKFIVRGVTYGLSKSSGRPMFTWKLAPLKDADDIGSVMTKLVSSSYTVLPKSDEDVAGNAEEERNQAIQKRSVYYTMAGVFGVDVIPDEPRAQKDSDGKYTNAFVFKDGVISASQKEEAIAEALATGMKAAEQLANDIEAAGEGKVPESISGRVVLGKIKHDPNSPAGFKVEMRRYLPKDAELLNAAQLGG